MKVSRHNGRSGRHGFYNPKYNDRRFDPALSDHIDKKKMQQNIYWDCYSGYRTQEQSVMKNRHLERNRSVDMTIQRRRGGH